MTVCINHACPFCGQLIGIWVDETMDVHDRDAMAKKKCGCPEAMRERDIADAMEKLEQVCGKASTENGFDTQLDNGAMQICKRTIEWVYDKIIRDAVIRSIAGDKIVIRADGTCIKIKRTSQKQLSM